VLPYHGLLARSMNIFASGTPTYSYDPRGDTLYIEYSRERAERTVEILKGWPILLVDLNAEEKITGIEFVGAKQFGVRHFAELLRGSHNGLVPGLENREAVADVVDRVGDDMVALAH
jgi:uncharacterized protein YuzE